MRDLVTALTLTSTGTTFSLSGLDANTPYTIQIWALDRGFNYNASHSFFETTGGISTSLGTVINSTTATPANNDEFSVTGTVTSDGSGVVNIGHTASAGNGAIDGFQLTVIPEPSAALLGMVGSLLLLSRRRA